MSSELKKIDIKYGDLELLVSGVFLASAEKESSLMISYKNDALKIILAFDNSDAKKGLTSKGEVIDGAILKVTLFNHNNSLGTHTTKPLYIGGIGNRKLYWYYRITQLSNKNDIPDAESILEIIYSFYLGSEASVATAN